MIINFKQLRYFVKTVETGNITKAADQLHLAQTALGLQIRNLETALGVPLLTRHSRGMRTTEAGRLLYERAVEILQSLEQARHDVMAMGGVEREEVALGITPSMMQLLGPDLLVSARRALPELPIRVVEEFSFALVDTLLRGEVDLALAYDVDDHPGLCRKALLKEELLFVTAPGAGVGTAPVRFRQVAASGLALVSERDVIWRRLHETAESLGLPVEVSYRVQSTQAMKALVMSGAATSVMPYGSIAEEMRAGTIVGRRIEGPRLARTLFLVSAANRAALTAETPLMTFLDGLVRDLADRLQPRARLFGDGLAPEAEPVPEPARRALPPPRVRSVPPVIWRHDTPRPSRTA